MKSFDMNLKGCHLGCTSLDLHISPSFEVILGNWQLARYRKMKYLESNLESFGKQHDIAYEISERINKQTKNGCSNIYEHE